MNKPPHSRAAQDFYAGMAQATHEAGDTFIPLARQEFARRGIDGHFDQSFGKRVEFSKRLHTTIGGVPRAPLNHAFARFQLEYFSCIAALNLYRLPQYTERFKAELITDEFLRHCAENEMEWLGIQRAELPKFEKETGHKPSHWRHDLIMRYLYVLKRKSSRDPDTLVAVHHFLTHMQLSKERGVGVSPALLEKLAKELEKPANWLRHYLRFHPL